MLTLSWALAGFHGNRQLSENKMDEGKGNELGFLNWEDDLQMMSKYIDRKVVVHQDVFVMHVYICLPQFIVMHCLN